MSNIHYLLCLEATQEVFSFISEGFKRYNFNLSTIEIVHLLRKPTEGVLSPKIAVISLELLYLGHLTTEFQTF